MILVIAEKPKMGRSIAQAIGATTSRDGYMEGNGYTVTWCIGHVVSLEHKTATNKWREDPLPLMDDFTLVPAKDKIGQINTINNLLKAADKVICATDAGREGELIFRYVYNYLQCKKPFQRLWISSLTDEAIRKGFRELKNGNEFDNLYFAAKARSESDWLVGVNGTRALTLAVNNGEVFSLGRVQSPTLSIISKRYLDNKNFVSKPFWTVSINTEKDGIKFSAKFNQSFGVEANAKAIQSTVAQSTYFLVTEVETKEKKESQPLLYDLTGLQKAAAKQHGITPDKTSQICQSLYESKYLSYPRTGSCYIPDDVYSTIPDILHRCKALNISGINTSYYDRPDGKLSKNCVNASKVTDHHGLLPTEVLPDLENLTKPEKIIYTMVVTRLFEAFHDKCTKDVTTAIITTAGDYDFHVKGTVITQAGWREVKPEKESEEDDEQIDDATLPTLNESNTLPNSGVEVKQGKTKPHPLFTDDTLLAWMETAGKECDDEHEREAMKNCGIGTPPTRDVIITNLLDKLYIVREKKNLLPTEKGLATYEIIKDKAIGSAALTGNWEKRLADIQNCDLEYNAFIADMRNFVTQFTAELQSVQTSIKSQKQIIDESMPLCPKCKQRRLKIFEKGISCSKECGFVIWRTVAHKPLSDNQLITLVEKGHTGKIQGLVSKSGTPDEKKFEAVLILKPDFTIGFDFGNKNKK